MPNSASILLVAAERRGRAVAAALRDLPVQWRRIGVAEEADTARAALGAESFDALLVDLELAGALAALAEMRDAAGEAAVVVIGDPQDAALPWVAQIDPPAAVASCLLGALERKRLRAELREARSELGRCDERFRSIIQRAADGVVIVAGDGRIRFVNRTAEAMFGRNAQDLRGHEFGYVVLSGETTEMDIVSRGEPLVAELRAADTVWDGEPAQVISLRDITDRKRADEQERKALLEQAARERAEHSARRARFLAEAGAVLDASLDLATTLNGLAVLLVPRMADWAVLDLQENGRVRRIARAHFDPSKQALLAELERYVPHPDSPQPSAEVLRSGEPIRFAGLTRERLRELAVNDRHAAVLAELGSRSAVTVPLKGRESPVGTLTLVCGERDFDDEDLDLAAEIGLRAGRAVENARLYEAALAASRAKSDFLGVISHELRTPLNAIIGYTQLLLETSSEITEEQRGRYLDLIRAAATHLNEIIEQILTYAQLEAGQGGIAARPVRLGDLIEEIRGAAGEMMAERGLEFRVRVPTPGAPLFSDPQKLRRIVMNLLSNAAKFTDRGHVELFAAVEREVLTLAVADTGRGIPEGDLERIFESFWVADRPLVREVGGAGVGLSVARQLALLLGGTLSVESAVGVGTTFALRIPARAGAGGDRPA